MVVVRLRRQHQPPKLRRDIDLQVDRHGTFLQSTCYLSAEVEDSSPDLNHHNSIA